jgi:hypothetical protein
MTVRPVSILVRDFHSSLTISTDPLDLAVAADLHIPASRLPDMVLARDQ